MEYAFLFSAAAMVSLLALGIACVTLAGLMHVAERATIRSLPHLKTNDLRKKPLS